LRALLPAPGAYVVVDVLLNDPPALPLGQPFAILDLPRHAKTVPFAV
jgi:hypothetical protein